MDVLNARGIGTLPGLVGVEILAVEPGQLRSRLPLRRELLAPNGYLHAASIIALADTTAGYATIAHLPEGAASFTTIELKSNFFATCREGAILAAATPLHAGRNTQVWDVAVTAEDDHRLIASFRCTQMVLWPQPS